MRGMFKVATVAGVAASMYAGYRAASHRGGSHNASGVGDATLPEETSRHGTRRFQWFRRQPAAGSPEETRELEAQRITE